MSVFGVAVVFAQGTASTATFSSPVACTADLSNLYVTDLGNRNIRRIQLPNTVSTLSGNATVATTFANGNAAVAAFHSPVSLAYYSVNLTTPASTLYIADNGNFCIRQLNIATTTISTLAGRCSVSAVWNVDGVGEAAAFTSLNAITLDSSKKLLYVASGNTVTCSIRTVDTSTAAVATLYSVACSAVASSSGLTAPSAILADVASSALFITDNNQLKAFSLTTGVISTVAGGINASLADGVGSAAAGFHSLGYGLAADASSKYLFLADTGMTQLHFLRFVCH